ncbi:MAG TPA: hypothetical protein VFV66_20505 [Nonomuraea sp.]|nr:hypothetical protein [Nonomuraea sp.]
MAATRPHAFGPAANLRPETLPDPVPAEVARARELGAHGPRSQQVVAEAESQLPR